MKVSISSDLHGVLEKLNRVCPLVEAAFACSAALLRSSLTDSREDWLINDREGPRSVLISGVDAVCMRRQLTKCDEKNLTREFSDRGRNNTNFRSIWQAPLWLAELATRGGVGTVYPRLQLIQLTKSTVPDVQFLTNENASDPVASFPPIQTPPQFHCHQVHQLFPTAGRDGLLTIAYSSFSILALRASIPIETEEAC